MFTAQEEPDIMQINNNYGNHDDCHSYDKIQYRKMSCNLSHVNVSQNLCILRLRTNSILDVC